MAGAGEFRLSGARFTRRDTEEVQRAGDRDSLAGPLRDLQRPPDYSGAVVHDPESHSSRSANRIVRKSAAVILYRKLEVVVEFPHRNENLGGPAVLGGVVHGLLSDAVEVNRR